MIVFVHGWGFDASFWQPVRDRLGGDSAAFDLGFRGTPAQPPVPDGAWAVGHSLGLLWLLRHRPFRWRGLISINGFPRFTRADDYVNGVPPRLLERMIQRLGSAPEAVYGDFMGRCGVAAPDSTGLDHGLLAQGLGWLRDWDARPLAEPVVALAGTLDPIVPPAMSRDAFAGHDLRWRQGGHLLPLTDSDWCAGQIRSILSASS